MLILKSLLAAENIVFEKNKLIYFIFHKPKSPFIWSLRHYLIFQIFFFQKPHIIFKTTTTPCKTRLYFTTLVLYYSSSTSDSDHESALASASSRGQRRFVFTKKSSQRDFQQHPCKNQSQTKNVDA